MTRAEQRAAALADVERALEADEVDDVLRGVLAPLTRLFGYVAVDFVEDGGVVTGPEHGSRPPSVERVPVRYDGVHVGDLVVDAMLEGDGELLERVAGLVSAHVLLGWDTGGEAWEP